MCSSGASCISPVYCYLTAMLPSQEHFGFISKVFSFERCIIFLVPPRKGMHFQLN